MFALLTSREGIILIILVIVVGVFFSVTSYYKESVRKEYEYSSQKNINKNYKLREKDDEAVQKLDNYNVCRQLNGLHDDCK